MNDSLGEKLYNLYVQGVVQWSLLLLASTVGTFTPLLIIASYSRPGHPTFLYLLWVFYITFSVASAYTLSRLLGSLFLSYEYMPSKMKEEHLKKVKDLDPLSLTRFFSRFSNHKNYVRLISWLALIITLLLYVLTMILYW